MTQLEQAGRRSTVLTSAAVAAVVSLAITISGTLVVPQLVSAPSSDGDAMRDARLDRAVAAGQAWEAHYELTSVHYRDRIAAIDEAGREWQERYELTNPPR